MLAGLDYRVVIVWELATGKERWRSEPAIESPIFAAGLQFSPDGRWLARGNSRFVQLYEVLFGQAVHSFAGHETSIKSLAFDRHGRTLASGSFDTTVLIWDMAPVLVSPRKGSIPADVAALEAAWKDLADKDAKVAFAAVRLLVDAGAGALPLRERLRPAQAPDPRQLERLLADLSSNRFPERERARNELERLADLAEPALKRFLTQDLSLEARRRAETILARVQGPVTDADKLRHLRALEVLEHIARPAARQILEVLAKGAPEARLTREARESLQRLAKRDGKSI